jgi:ATP-dependent Clp protease ATP-binding subunit ClpC
MPKINVYLSDDLAEAVKDTGLPVSAVCQRALEQAVRRVTGMREIAAWRGGDRLGGAEASEFTARVLTIMETAQAEAAADGVRALDSGHLLGAIVADQDSMAVRVLAALDITPGQVRAELDRRVASGDPRASASAGSAGTLSPEVAMAAELATNESSGLGNSYVGTEHLLLGLIGESEGVAGHVLRSLGADLRVTRRIVAAALAGWGARAEVVARQDETTSHADHVAAAVRTELAPVLARIERLESLAAR